MKKCIRCGEEKEEEAYGWHNKQKGWRRTVCRPCRLDDTAEWRKKHRLTLNQKIKDRFRKRKLYWIKEKGGKCQSCGGEFHPSVYDFHHTEPSKKKYSPGQMFSRKIETVTEEMKTCILLCSNCHRVLHNDY